MDHILFRKRYRHVRHIHDILTKLSDFCQNGQDTCIMCMPDSRATSVHPIQRSWHFNFTFVLSIFQESELQTWQGRFSKCVTSQQTNDCINKVPWPYNCGHTLDVIGFGGEWRRHGGLGLRQGNPGMGCLQCSTVISPVSTHPHTVAAKIRTEFFNM